MPILALPPHLPAAPVHDSLRYQIAVERGVPLPAKLRKSGGKIVIACQYLLVRAVGAAGSAASRGDRRLKGMVPWAAPPCFFVAEGRDLPGCQLFIFFAVPLGRKLRRDGLQIISDAAEIEPLASTVQDNGGVFFVPAFAGLGAPYWDQYARGAIVGLTRGVTRGHIARAAIEAIALQTLDIMDCMKKDSGLPLSTLRVDGGASRNNMLMQCQANVLGVPVERPVITETTALGAAYLAGLAVGFWDSEEEVSTLWKLDRRFEPSMDEDRRAELLHNWHRAVGRAANWIE